MELLFVGRIPFWKRCMDITGALAALVLFSPVFLFLYLLLKITSPGPAFFLQKRIGRGGKPFTMIKFRTMHVNADDSVHKQYLKDIIHESTQHAGALSRRTMKKLDKENDPRIIPIGKFLRKSHMDELPQLINVLRGEMSLVGPRPPIPYEAEEYALWHQGRLNVIPGMTGLWQVSGKNDLTFEEMCRLDIVYSRRCSPWMDLSILFRTVFVVASQAIQ
ncbi:MAG: sugar transferase [Candidatus Omnitrophica bacterium]|nr:sugar transferase [Candidatus Omnitrophota bacterium]